MNVPLFEIYNDEEDIKLISEEIASGKYLAVGSRVSEFEEKIAEYIGTKHALTFNSGTSALHASLLAQGIGKNDEVIVPSFTFIATANCALFVGAKPVFADIEEGTCGLNPDSVQDLINKNTKAIIPVHYGGCPCQINELKDIAEDNDLILIEDAAEAFGASVDDKNVGTFGDLNVLSFCQNLKLIRSHGRLEGADYFSSSDLFDYIDVGFNWRMSNLTATLGISQINKVDKIIEMRQKNANYLSKRLLEETDSVFIPEVPKGYNNVYQLFSILVDKRDELIKYLSDNGISSKIYFHPVHQSELYKNKLDYNINLPITESIFEKTLTLPMFPSITEEQMDYIADTVGNFYKI